MSNARDPYNLCQFTFANGRMCGLPAHPKSNGLCLTHARRAKPEPREDDLSADLITPSGDFLMQIDINHVLGQLFRALASNRISARRAGTLAYIGCLLQQSQKGAREETIHWDDREQHLLKKLMVLKYGPLEEVPPDSVPRPIRPSSAEPTQ